MGSVVEDKLASGDKSGSMNSIIGIDQSRAGLGQRLVRVAVSEARWDLGSGGLEEIARSPSNGWGLSLCSEEQSRCSGDEGGSHRCARGNSKATEREGVRRHDVSSRSRQGRLEGEVVRGAEGRERGHQSAGRAESVDPGASLGERNSNVDASEELVDKLWFTCKMQERRPKHLKTHEFSICSLDKSSSVCPNGDTSKAVSIAGENTI